MDSAFRRVQSEHCQWQGERARRSAHGSTRGPGDPAWAIKRANKMPEVTRADGPVAVTGASGYIGSHVVAALVKRGYIVRACVTDQSNPDKTAHLLALNNGSYPGRVE